MRMFKRNIASIETIPAAQVVCKKLSEFQASDPKAAHGYDALFANLELLSRARPAKIILVTSTQPEEGKSTIALNLALTMMLHGKNVLLLDGDLRKPQLHRSLQVRNAPGLADILSGAVGVQETIQKVNVASDSAAQALTLNVIPSGKGPRALFNPKGSTKLHETFEYLRSFYDVILVDSPPILAVNDGLFFVPIVDAVLFVVHPGVVTEKDAKRAKERILQAGGHIVGAVMNRFTEGVHGEGYHPYDDHYMDAQQ